MAETLSPEIAEFIQKRDEVEEKDRLPLPNIESLSPNLREITDRIAKLTGDWNPIELCTPINMKEQNEKFSQAFKQGEVYNPTFTYQNALDFVEAKEVIDDNGNVTTRYVTPHREELQSLLSQIRQFDPSSEVERLARVSLYSKVKDDLATCDIAEGIANKDEKQIKRGMRRKYGKPDPFFFSLARKGLDEEIKKRGANQESSDTPDLAFLKKISPYTPQETASVFTWALQEYDMLYPANPQGYEVKIDEEAQSIDVRDKSKNGRPVIVIPEKRLGKKIDGYYMTQLLGHEIDGHCRQSMNGRELFSVGELKMDDEKLYEGLAKREDKRVSDAFGDTSVSTASFFYALAIESAENGKSFYEIFSEQRKYRLHEELSIPLDEKLPDTDISSLTEEERKEMQNKIGKAEELAFKTTYRVMRGHTDTSNPESFAMPKDMAYLVGRYQDEELQAMGLGYYNEAAILQRGGLNLLARFKLTEESLPHQYKAVWKKYWEEVLKPQIDTGKSPDEIIKDPYEYLGISFPENPQTQNEEDEINNKNKE